jgi:hypothetical protein
MMQIAKVSLFLAGSAAFTSAVRVTSRGRRMQPIDNPPEESKQSTTPQQACSEISQLVAHDLVFSAGANLPTVSHMKFADIREMAFDYLSTKFGHLENSSHNAHDLVNGHPDIAANWNEQRDKLTDIVTCAVIASKSTKQQTAETAAKKVDPQIADDLARTFGTGFNVAGTDKLTLKGITNIAKEFLEKRMEKLETYDRRNVESMANVNPIMSANYLFQQAQERNRQQAANDVAVMAAVQNYL